MYHAPDLSYLVHNLNTFFLKKRCIGHVNDQRTKGSFNWFLAIQALWDQIPPCEHLIMFATKTKLMEREWRFGKLLKPTISSSSHKYQHSNFLQQRLMIHMLITASQFMLQWVLSQDSCIPPHKNTFWPPTCSPFSPTVIHWLLWSSFSLLFSSFSCLHKSLHHIDGSLRKDGLPT